MIAHTIHDVRYLPLPNRIEIVITDEPAPIALTRTAFMIPLLDNGDVVLAMNQRRGIEVPGGHIDPGETPEIAAIRETFEETGAKMTSVRPLGYLRMISEGEAPDGWKYPHPISYQQFYTGRVTDIQAYEANDECAAPVIVGDLSALDKPALVVWVEQARRLLGH